MVRLIPKGTVWVWDALIEPPEGWAFWPMGRARFAKHWAWPIVALEDHDSPPVAPQWVLDTIAKQAATKAENELFK